MRGGQLVGSNDQRDAQETLMGGSAASFRFTKLGVGQLGSRRYLITAVDGDPCKEPEKVLLLIQLIGSGRGSSHANLPYQLSATKSLNFFPSFLFQGNFWPYFIDNWSFPVFVFLNVSLEQNDQRSPFVSTLTAQTKLPVRGDLP